MLQNKASKPTFLLFRQEVVALKMWQKIGKFARFSIEKMANIDKMLHREYNLSVLKGDMIWEYCLICLDDNQNKHR